MRFRKNASGGINRAVSKPERRAAGNRKDGKNERNGQMSIAPKAETIAKFARKDGDTGSPEVQIALMTARIVHLTEHLKRNRKDYSTQTGLLALVNRRKKLLAYLARENYERYVSLCAELNIRRK